ncbi:unnamed protein product [Acidithrix sp. C25]|nr:unnamed protein product [Acidithrix sp. C25]
MLIAFVYMAHKASSPIVDKPLIDWFCYKSFHGNHIRSHRTLVVTLTIYFLPDICPKDDFEVF